MSRGRHRRRAPWRARLGLRPGGTVPTPTRPDPEATPPEPAPAPPDPVPDEPEILVGEPEILANDVAGEHRSAPHWRARRTAGCG